MATDPVELVAMQRVIDMSARVEGELLNLSSPMVMMLHRARKEAAAAMIQLVDVDFTKTEEIRLLQNKIMRFSDMVRWLKDIVREGIENDQRITNEQRDELANILLYQPDGGGSLDADEALEAGLMERSPFDA